MLTRGSEKDFFFWREQITSNAMDTIKDLMTTASVLIVIKYKDARRHSKLDSLAGGDLNGLVVVRVDSCKNRAGWILQQFRGKEKKPALFGLCTFNDMESRYSQPKYELYRLFCIEGIETQDMGSLFLHRC